MAGFEPMTEFEGLMTSFPQQYRNVNSRTSDPYIGIARAGFSIHEQSSYWNREHEEIILAYRAGDYSDDSLEWYEDTAQAIASFACYALGALMGLYNRGQIDDAEFQLGEVLLPTTLMEHNETIGAVV